MIKKNINEKANTYIHMYVHIHIHILKYENIKIYIRLQKEIPICTTFNPIRYSYLPIDNSNMNEDIEYNKKCL